MSTVYDPFTSSAYNIYTRGELRVVELSASGVQILSPSIIVQPTSMEIFGFLDVKSAHTISNISGRLRLRYPGSTSYFFINIDVDVPQVQVNPGVYLIRLVITTSYESTVVAL